jgi:hypothetical protein
MARRLQIDWRESEEELYKRYKEEKDYQTGHWRKSTLTDKS